MTTSKAGENNAGKLDHSYIARGNVEWYKHSGKAYFLKKQFIKKTP